jgi:hypothetical protein
MLFEIQWGQFNIQVTELARACYETSMSDVLLLLPQVDWRKEKSHPLHFAMISSKPKDERKLLISVLVKAGLPVDGYSYLIAVTSAPELFFDLPDPVITEVWDVRYLDWALNIAASHQRSDQIARLIDLGASPDAYHWFYNGQGKKALHHICEKADLTCLREVINDRNALVDVLSPNNEKLTPLDLLKRPPAIQKDPAHLLAMKQMLEKQAELNERSDSPMLAPFGELFRFGGAI